MNLLRFRFTFVSSRCFQYFFRRLSRKFPSMCDKNSSPCPKRARVSSDVKHTFVNSCGMEDDTKRLAGSGETANNMDEISCHQNKSSDSDSLKFAGECGVVQSPNDKRLYGVITLKNGLTALLISDLTNDDAAQSDYESEEEEEDMEEEDEEESEGEEEEEEEEEEHGPGRKHGKKPKHSPSEKLAAAGLCIGSGSFSDPQDIPGLAHFLEHMVFMGSEKYPEENSFDSFINKHGGHDNAYTECERTVFYFEVNRHHFRESLDRFAQFFISPLMKKDSVDREILAVDSEFMMNQVSDSCRKEQLIGACAHDSHPMGKFFWGNSLSLKQRPLERNIDVYDRLKSFYQHMYSSHYMTLVVQSKETLDNLEQWVKDIFTDVPHNGKDQQTFSHLTDAFNKDKFHKLYKMVPIKDVHQLEITWMLPPMHPHYRSKPLHYVGWLVGHEGKGSLLSYLKSRCWGLSISSGNGGQGYEQNQTCSSFVITITLTDEGINKADQVLTAVFQYLDMLRRSGPSQRIFEEIQTIENNEFRWKEQYDPVDYVQRLCENMQLYPPQHYLSGDDLLFEYDPKIIADCQNLLTAEKANILLLSKNYEKDGVCTMTEPWFGTSYTICDIPSDWIDSWKNSPVCIDLHLPDANEYIATDFSLKPNPVTAPPEGFTLTPPLNISSSDTRSMWFKADSKFKIPKAYIYFHLSSPMVNASPKSLATFELFERLLSQNLAEVAYAADVAQLSYEFGIPGDGLEIKLNGFNHKLQKLFETIVDHIADYTIDDDMFVMVKEQLVRSYYNKMIKTESMVKEARFATLYKTFHSTAEKRTALLSVDKDMLASFVSQYKTNCYIEGFVHGNYTAEEAASIQDYITSRLQNSLPRKDTVQAQLVDLPKAKCCLQIKSFNPTDPNSAVECYYQHGPGDLHEAEVNELLEMIMEEPCFNYLRTQEQLGYHVCSYNLDTAGIIGMSISVHVQATKFSTKFVDTKITDFLQHFSEFLEKMTKEEFESQVSSLITLKRCEDTHLGEEASRHWSEIRKKRYLFNRLDIEVSELSSLTLEEVKAWFQKLMMAEDQKQLSVQIVGADTSVDQTDGQLKPVDTETGMKSFQLIENETEENHIDSLTTFKNSLSCYPVSKIMPRS